MGKKVLWYWIKTLFLALFVTPIMMNLVTGAYILLEDKSLFGLVPLLLMLVWLPFVKKSFMPKSAFLQYLPIFISLSYFLGVWCVTFALGDYSYYEKALSPLMLWNSPFLLPNILFSITGDYMWYPYMLLGIYGFILLLMIAGSYFFKKQPEWRKPDLIYIPVLFLMIVLPLYQQGQHEAYYLKKDNTVLKLQDEIKQKDYAPYTEKSIALYPKDRTDLGFENYPQLDGETALYPFYSSMGSYLYENLTKREAGEYIKCSQINAAYENLLSGKADVIFVTALSEPHLEKAKIQGLTLKATPIAKDAFVFFVQPHNLVKNLTTKQIQGIYQNRIHNWQEVGGKNEKIYAFQHAKKSCNQQMMTEKIMKNKKMGKPLKEEYADGLRGITSEVALYRNYSSAIGYSYRYFVEQVPKANEQLRLLSVNGIEPSIENIRKDRYPYVTTLYAVTLRPDDPDNKKLMDWILSPAGQSYLTRAGYVALK